eukprot:3219088-Rhodomonas_salina.1
MAAAHPRIQSRSPNPLPRRSTPHRRPQSASAGAALRTRQFCLRLRSRALRGTFPRPFARSRRWCSAVRRTRRCRPRERKPPPCTTSARATLGARPAGLQAHIPRSCQRVVSVARCA